MTELDFPSVRYVYDELATRLGARIVVVPSDDGIGVDEERLLAAIDERTRLVSISHVLFRSAYVMDADAHLPAHAHEVGALVALDAFHSVGVMPGGRASARRRLPHGRRAEVAVRRPRRMLPLGRARTSSATPRARAHRMAGARASVRLRGGDGLRRRRVALARRHAGDPGAVRGDRGAAPLREAGIDAHAREEHAADGAADRARGRARLRGHRAARSSAARRHGGVRRAARATRSRRRCSRATSSSTTGRAPASVSRRTSIRATTSSSGRACDDRRRSLARCGRDSAVT